MDENEFFIGFQVLLSTDSIPTGPAGYKLPSPAWRRRRLLKQWERALAAAIMTSHCWEPIQLPNNAGEWIERLGYYAEEPIPEAIQRGGRSPGSGIIVVRRGNKGGLKTPIGRCDDGSKPLLG